MNRWTPVLSVLVLCLGLVFVAGATLPPSAPILPPAVAAMTTSPVPQRAPGPSATPTPPIADGYRIKIARLGIDLPIAEGDLERDAGRQQTPENFAFHLPGSAIPGNGGNSYIYAHARRGMFLNLWNAREGDEVLVITADGRALRFVVSEVHSRVDPSDVAWAAPTASERLTLQTSTGPTSSDPRFVVIALPG